MSATIQRAAEYLHQTYDKKTETKMLNDFTMVT